MYAKTVNVNPVVIDQAKLDRWVEETTRKAFDHAVETAVRDAVEKELGGLVLKAIARRLKETMDSPHMAEWLDKIVGQAWGSRSPSVQHEVTKMMNRADLNLRD
jgi:hypothetical protein